MEKALKGLYKAAVEGNLTFLIDLLQQDTLILERSMVQTFGETPLHIAAMLGHVEFCLQLLSRKPELAGEFDSRRSSPLHLASAKGHVVIVKALLSVKPEMCFACDGDGNNPLHVAAIKGKVGVLKELVKAQPDAACARGDGGVTILHLCVQYYQLDALKLLIEDLNDLELLNARDDQGNTILHLAVADKNFTIIRYLLVTTSIDVNAQNSYGLTPLDILASSRRDAKDLDIADSLQQAGARKCKEIRPLPAGPELGNNNDTRERLSQSTSKSWDSYFKKQDEWLNKQSNALMVVASLIATMAFQAGIAPPGGVWQDNKEGQIAGRSIFADRDPADHKAFMMFNTVSFISSLSIILLLISGLPLKRKVSVWILMVIMWISVSSTAMAYCFSLLAFVRRELWYTTVAGMIVLVWVFLMGLVVLSHTIRLIFAAIKRIRRCFRGERRRSRSVII